MMNDDVNTILDNQYFDYPKLHLQKKMQRFLWQFPCILSDFPTLHALSEHVKSVAVTSIVPKLLLIKEYNDFEQYVATCGSR